MTAGRRLTWDRDVATALAETARRAVDLGSAPARLLRLGTNASFRIGDVVVRIAPQGRPVDAAAREIETARMLEEHGVRAVRPAADVPFVVGRAAAGSGGARHVVTLWRWVDHDPRAIVDGFGFGALLRAFHRATDADDRPLPPWPQWDLIGGRIAGLRTNPAFRPGEVDLLDRALDDLRRRLADDPAPHRPIHGDAHPGNVIVGPDGPVLLDFDLVGRGPRPWDLAPAALHVRRYGGDPAWFAAARAGYGEPALPHEADYVDLRELASAVWRLAAEGAPDPTTRAPEVDARLAALAGERDPPTWRAS
ncbi:MAG: aminoglycoside phosphotransferase family protein [Solirubrobacteraceae bacterium]|nr:aminoglycoside phosphotransferase family protein [Solirubrobacteraceae bacterium]